MAVFRKVNYGDAKKEILFNSLDIFRIIQRILFLNPFFMNKCPCL